VINAASSYIPKGHIDVISAAVHSACRTNSARGANARVKKVARAKGLAAHTCLGVEPRVEAFSAWAEGVFLGLSAEGKEIVPQAVLQTVCDKWKSQEY
jgi:hypothetical protein